MQKLEALGRLLKRAIWLIQFDINYEPRTTIKGQAFSNFIAEFTYARTVEIARIVGMAEAMEKAETT